MLSNRERLRPTSPTGLGSTPRGSEPRSPSAGIQLDRRAEIDAEAMQPRRERIAVLWAQEATQREIAHELGITVAALAATMARMRHNGWDLPLRRERTPRKAPLRDRIAGLWVKGHTIAEIADETGRTTSQVASELAWMRR